MAELKPCPFCGGKAKVVKEIGGVHWKVKCRSCSCEVGRYWFVSKIYAEKAWNTRTPKEQSEKE